MHPNIIVFLTDQQRYDTVGAYGNPLDITPNLDAYARQGTLCMNAFTPQPICCPARSCIQTGKYATQTGCYRNGISITNRENKSLADYFNEAGYKTGYIGKWHLAINGIVKEEERAGYQYWLGSNLLEFSSDAYDLVMYDNDNQPVKIPGYRVDGVVDRAISFIDQNKAEPFFLFVSLLEPHCQNHSYSYEAPAFTKQKYQGKWMPPDLMALGGTAPADMAGYLATVHRIDEAFGRMMDALRSLNMLDNTVVLFTSDHGEHFMTRNSTNKMSPHESSIRIPMVFHGPGFEGGMILQNPVSLIDILPTLLDAADIPIPQEAAGRSVKRLVDKSDKNWPEEVLIQISETQVGRCIRTRKWKYAVTAPDKEPFLDSSSNCYTETELYDLEHDPYELRNLICFSGFEHVKKELCERLCTMIEKSGECRPEIIPVISRPQPDGILPQMFMPKPEAIRDISNSHRYIRPRNEC